MRRIFIGLVLICGATWFGSPQGLAQQAPPASLQGGLPECDKGEAAYVIDVNADELNCIASQTTRLVDTTTHAVEDWTPVGDALQEYKRVTIRVVWGGSDGAPCVRLIDRWVPVGQAIPDDGVPDRISVCPDNLLGDPAGTPNSGANSSPETPQSYAEEYWRRAPLPKPQPHIAPGRAITGMFAYLETGGTTRNTYTEPDTPFGPLTVVATGRYYVDWGDGTKTGPHAAEGGPWPDGNIKHEYIHVGAYDVIVTERWTATWSFGDQSGTVTELRSVGRIEDFPVQQIQAVVLR